MTNLSSTRELWYIPTSASFSFLKLCSKLLQQFISQSRWQKLQSWRVGITLCAFGAGITFFVNLAWIIWASTKGFEGGIATIQEGDCSVTKRLDLWLHLGINVLSTLLLGGSNYTMQCLSAPTRDEIDQAHQQRISLDIGTLSIGNLRKISWRRIVLWWLLALSSLPLHLMYNSAVFSTLSTNTYVAAVVSHDFLTGAPFNDTEDVMSKFFISRLTALRENQSTLQYLSNDECVKAYTQLLLPDRQDVLLVSTATKTNTSLLSYWVDEIPWDSCIPHCHYPVQNWTVLDSPIEYCLSQHTEQSCKEQLSLVIMAIVILCNFAKTLCMSLTIWKPSPMPLLTLGDVIASFLDQPDPNTANNCIASKYRFRGVKRACLIDKNQHRQAGWDEAIKTCKSEYYRWYHATSLKRWLICFSFITFTLVTAGLLLSKVLNALHDESISHLWSLGYGQFSYEAMISFYAFPSGKFIPSILLANLPQALLSFLYLTYNALFTSMLLAEEWSGFAHQRKTLRVTSPVGKQRSTYWLQLPYSYGIPLLAMSGILHWLVSQSIFLIRVTMNQNNTVEEPLVSSLGYSPIAIITVIPLGALLLFVAIGNGFRKYKQGMPLAGSCSAAISAACHRPEEDEDAAVLPVLWGAVSTEGPIGHCCFTSFEVSAPVNGQLYAARDAMSSIDAGTTTGTASGQAEFGLRSRL